MLYVSTGTIKALYSLSRSPSEMLRFLTQRDHSLWKATAASCFLRVTSSTSPSNEPSLRVFRHCSTYIYIWLRPTKSGPVGLKKLTFHTFHHVQYNGCFKHMNYRLSMSNKPCHTIFFSFRMVGLQSWVLRVTKSSRFLRYPQDTTHFLCFYHVQINTYNLLYCMIPIVDDHG